MIISTPLKEKKTKRNVRKAPSQKRSNGTGINGRRSNGHSHGKRKSKSDGQKRLTLPTIKPWKVILGAFVLGAIGVLYLSHVFATQELLEEVQQLERQYNQAKRMNDDYRLTYDRMIGPAEIYDNARAMGFINGGPAEKVIEVEAVEGEE